MYKAKTFTLGAVSSTFSRGEHPLFRSKPRPFFGRCPIEQRQWKCNQYPHDTIQIWGIWTAQVMCRKDQPSEKLGFGFICYIIYSDDLCFSKGTSLYTLIALYKRHQLPFQKQMGRLHSQSSATSVYPGTPAMFTWGCWGYSWRWLLMHLRRRISSEQIRSLVRLNHCLSQESKWSRRWQKVTLNK